MFGRDKYVDSRYALKEEVDEVKADVKIIKADTVELKSVMNFIKWLILATVPVTALVTNLGAELKDSIKNEPEVQIQRQQMKPVTGQVLEHEGKIYLVPIK